MEALRKNHFAFFSLTPAFRVDEAALGQAFKRVQSAVHPDRFVNAGAAERRYAVQLAAHANEAYRTLSNPLERAKYLCELNGLPVGAEDNTAMPPAFLMEQMEWREALDEAREQGDAAALRALIERNRREQEALGVSLGELIDTKGDFEGAAALVRQWMFLDRFGAQLRLAGQAMAR